MASAARATRSFTKAWFSDPATYPLIGILGFAGCLTVAGGVRFLSTSPDVIINKEKRGDIGHRSIADANSFRSHRIAAANLQENPITRHPEYQRFKDRNS